MNTLKVAKHSSLHTLSCTFSFIMFLTFIIYLEAIDGKLGFGYTVPIFGENAFIIFFNLLSFAVPITMLIFCIVYAKNKLEFMVFPYALTPFSYLLYEIYSITQSDGFFILRQWYKVGASVLLLVMFILTINKRIFKTKNPMVLTCMILIVSSIVMTLCNVGPFVYIQPSFIYQSQFYDKHVVVYIAALVQYLSYVGSILCLTLSLKPADEADKEKEDKRFKVMKNLDRIQALSRK